MKDSLDGCANVRPTVSKRIVVGQNGARRRNARTITYVPLVDASARVSVVARRRSAWSILPALALRLRYRHECRADRVAPRTRHERGRSGLPISLVLHDTRFGLRARAHERHARRGGSPSTRARPAPIPRATNTVRARSSCRSTCGRRIRCARHPRSSRPRARRARAICNRRSSKSPIVAAPEADALPLWRGQALKTVDSRSSDRTPPTS